MITPKHFFDSWDKEIDPLVEYDINKINLLNLPNEAKDFLIEAGLPESASPFLNFESSAKGGAVKLTEKYKVDNGFSKYVYLGFTGNGDVICLVEGNGEVVYLEHENEYNEVFMNSSITKLAEILLEYSNFVNKIKSVNGRRAFLDRNATQEHLEWITNRITGIDPKSLSEGSFWREELDHFAK